MAYNPYDVIAELQGDKIHPTAEWWLLLDDLHNRRRMQTAGRFVCNATVHHLGADDIENRVNEALGRFSKPDIAQFSVTDQTEFREAGMREAIAVRIVTSILNNYEVEQ